VPEQEFRPPSRPARPGFSGRDDDDPPPWANMPPIRPAGSHRRAEAPAPHPGRPEAGDPYLASHATSPGAAVYEDAAYDDRAYSDGTGQDGPGTAQQVPPWAGPDAEPENEIPAPGPRAPGSNGPGRRALAHAARRRRRWFMLGGALVVIAGAVVAVILLTGGSGPAPVTPDGLITTFQPGELRQVPDACKAVPAATVAQYLPGQVHQSAPLAVNGTAESACNWTIDAPPVYRLMEVNVLAYAPNGLASGNGSATQAARDAFSSARQNLASPSQQTVGSRATVTTVSGLGDEAFSAQQVFKAGGATTDVATVEVRYHNVIVTATLNGLDHSNKGKYGPVSPSQLATAALAFAKTAEAALH
jgi:hypothetical protein